MESLLSKQFERVLEEFRIMDDVKDYIKDILLQLEINEKDREM